MKLVLSKDDPTNTQLSTEDGRLLFDISTPNHWRNVVTSVTKFVSEKDGRAQEIASVKYRAFSPSEVTYNGQTVKVDDFLSYRLKKIFTKYAH